MAKKMINMGTVREFGTAILPPEYEPIPWDPELIPSYVETREKCFPNFKGEPERLVDDLGQVYWYVALEAPELDRIWKPRYEEDGEQDV